MNLGIGSLIEKRMKQYHVTGCSIALIDGDKTVFSQGFGYADKEHGIPAAADTPYLIASVTKVFTGTAVMQLAEKGKIDLDKPVQEYIREFSCKTRFEEAGPITVRSLLTHHSGLPGDNLGKFYNQDPNEENNTFRTVIPYLKEHYACYPPHYVWSYSNLGTDLLGMIIERVSGTDYCSYMKEFILKPLNMAKSSLVTDAEARAGMAKPYHKGRFDEEHYLRDLPAGSIISTASDMAEFIKMVLAGGTGKYREILRHDTVREMLTPQNGDVALDTGFKMGLSWILEWPFFDYAGKVCWHDGSSVHYNNLMIVLPDLQLGMILMSNSRTALPVFLREAAEEILLRAVERKAGLKPFDQRKNDAAPAITKDSLKKYTGSYASILGLTEIRESNGKLRLSMSGMKTDMVPNGDGWFSLKYRALGVVPVNLKQLRSIRVNVFGINGVRTFAMEQQVSRHKFVQNIGREYTAKAIPESWRRMTGKYQAAEKDNRFIKILNLSDTGGVLSIQTSARKLGRLQLVLDVISDSEAIVAGLGRHAGETITVWEENGNTVLELLGLKFIRMH